VTPALQHAIDWFEIPCADIDRAQRFYEHMLGQPLVRENYGGPGMSMAVLPAQGELAVRGALQAGPGVAQPSMDGTVVYLAAGLSIDAAVERALQAGAQVIVPVTALPGGMGFFAHVRDTEGNRVGLHAQD
jgi:predicted enzyme related to lactoylglutathione lyase